MAIDVYCNCGNALSVSSDLAGRKIRCKKCKEILEIPKVGLSESMEQPAPDDYEVVSEETETRTCPSCGANASIEDTACLACGADLAEGGLGFLDKIPQPVLLGVAILILLGMLYGVGSVIYNSWRPGRYVATGRAALNQEDYPAATKAFKAALTFDAKYKDAIEGLALVGAKQPDPALLKRYARAAAKTMTDTLARAELRIAYGWVLLDEGDPDGAHNAAIDAKADDPEVRGLHALLGLAAVQLKKPDKALEHLQEASAKNSKRPQVYANLAKLYEAKKDYLKGRAAAEKLVELAPDVPENWLLVGTLRRLTNDPTGYAAALHKAAELDPKNPDAHSRLSKVYLKAGQLKEALEAAEKAASLAPKNAEAHMAVGRIYLAFKRPVAAREALERALKLDKDSWEAQYLLGKAQVLTKKTRKGLNQIKKALRQRKGDLALHLDAARVAIEGGEAHEAAGFLRGQLRAHPDDYDLRVVLAEALRKEDRGEQRNGSRIQEHLQHAISCDPDRPEAPVSLGEFLYGQLRDAEALKVLDAGLKKNPQNKGLLYTKGRVAHRLKKYDEAIKALEACGDYKDAKAILHQVKEDQYYNQGFGD